MQFFQERQQQLSDGWVKGPFTMQQMDERFGGCWIPSKRFGVRQGGKVRAVDDFSEFLVNASVTSTEKLALYGIDEVINTARFFMGIDAITFDCDGFPVLAHCDCTGAGPWKQLQGRALDLKAAYKQLARHPDDAWGCGFSSLESRQQQRGLLRVSCTSLWLRVCGDVL